MEGTQEFWLDLANAALGVVVLAILLALMLTITWEALHGAAQRLVWRHSLRRELCNIPHR